MTNYFDSPFKGKLLSEQVKNPNIKVGRYSYYSGYYHGHSFDDCARYLFPDRDDVDKLIIGSFCSIGSGASFIMAGNQGHRYDWASSFPFFYMQEEPAFSSALDAFQKAGNTVIGNDVWIGSEAMVMPGIKIGHGAVIGCLIANFATVPVFLHWLTKPTKAAAGIGLANRKPCTVSQPACRNHARQSGVSTPSATTSIVVFRRRLH